MRVGIAFLLAAVIGAPALAEEMPPPLRPLFYSVWYGADPAMPEWVAGDCQEVEGSFLDCRLQGVLLRQETGADGAAVCVLSGWRQDARLTPEPEGWSVAHAVDESCGQIGMLWISADLESLRTTVSAPQSDDEDCTGVASERQYSSAPVSVTLDCSLERAVFLGLE